MEVLGTYWCVFLCPLSLSPGRALLAGAAGTRPGDTGVTSSSTSIAGC